MSTITNLLREELKQDRNFGDEVTRDLMRAAVERIEELETPTSKRIEMVRLLQFLRRGNERSGDTILRALLFSRRALEGGE